MELNMIFKNLSASIGFLNDDMKFEIIKNMIFFMNLNEEDSYTALVASNFSPRLVFNYDKACDVLGKIVVDEILKTGNFTDNFDPILGKNLDYLVNPEKRKQFYDEYIKNNTLRRTGSICIRLHKNFTLALIEHEVNQ